MKDVGIEAKEWFEGHGEDLVAAILNCFFRGAIIKHNNFLLMGEPCRTEGRPEILNGLPDTWWVYYWGGTRGKFTCFDVADNAPNYYPFVAFKRHGRIKVKRWEQFLRTAIRPCQVEEVA
jgi:hypothetical protein